MVEIDSFLILAEEEYEDGDVILREGTSTDWIYIILEGRVNPDAGVRPGRRTIPAHPLPQL